MRQAWNNIGAYTDLHYTSLSFLYPSFITQSNIICLGHPIVLLHSISPFFPRWHFLGKSLSSQRLSDPERRLCVAWQAGACKLPKEIAMLCWPLTGTEAAHWSGRNPYICVEIRRMSQSKKLWTLRFIVWPFYCFLLISLFLLMLTSFRLAKSEPLISFCWSGSIKMSVYFIA